MRNPYVFQALPDKISFRREKQRLLYDPEKEISNTIRPSLGNCVVTKPNSLSLSLSGVLYLEAKLGCNSNPTFLPPSFPLKKPHH